MFSILRTSSPKTTMVGASGSFLLFLVVLLNGTEQPFPVLAAPVRGKTIRNKEQQRHRGVKQEENLGSLQESTGYGKGKSGSSKGSKDFSFDGNAKGKTKCVPQKSYLIVGTNDPIGVKHPHPDQVTAGTAQTTCKPFYDAVLLCGVSALPAGCVITALYQDFLKCAKDENYIEGPWFYNRDTAGTTFEFTSAYSGSKGSAAAVCFQMLDDPTGKGKGEMEFWSESFFGTPIGDLLSIEFDYKVFAPSTPHTNQVFLNIYTRNMLSSTAYYDCRFDYVFDATPVTDASSFKNFKVTLATVSDDAITHASTGGAGCGAAKTLQAYLAANPMAVIGVGRGELETLTFNTGQTGAGNEGGLGVCWDNVEIRTKYQNYIYDFEEVNIFA